MQDEHYLERLRAYWKHHKAFPSMAKLCDIVGLSSTSTVFAMVGRLVDAGYLERTERRIAPTKKFFARTLLVPVHASQAPSISQEEPCLVSVDDYLIDEPHRTSIHRVNGDSMKALGIFDGDLLAVEHNTPPKPGDIVMTCVDNELSIEPLHPEGSLENLGIVVGLIRRLRA